MSDDVSSHASDRSQPDDVGGEAPDDTSGETLGETSGDPSMSTEAPGKRRKKKRSGDASSTKRTSRAEIETSARELSPDAIERGKARRTFGISSILLLTGIALSAADQAALGSWIAVAGLAGAIWGTHLLGRLGVEA